jgi:hypothetical protein
MNGSEASIIPHRLHQLSTNNDKNTQVVGGNFQIVVLV